MTSGIIGLIAALSFLIYAIVQWRYNRRHAHLNVIYTEYNLWVGLGLMSTVVCLAFSVMAFRANYKERTRAAEIEQCDKMERVWPGRMLFTDHCYFEMRNGIYMTSGGMDANLYTKEEVLARKP